MDIEKVATRYRQFSNAIQSETGALSVGDTEIFGEFRSLFRTFSSASFDQMFASPPSFSGEWNPFSQRPTLAALPEGGSFFGETFELAQQALTSFVIAFHEIFHVVLLEPFFTGQAQIQSADQFAELCLMSEAFCFFYADIVLTRRLRARFPDGEPILSRSAVSQSTFHPYQAFLALGISDKEQILQIYLDTFRGKPTALLSGPGNSLYPSDLSRRLYLFYNVAKAPLRALYQNLHEVSLFSEFFERFCQVPDIPALFVDENARSAGSAWDENYFFSFYKKQQRRLTKISPKLVQRTQSRRAIQTRAYFAFQLRFQIREQKILFLKEQSFTQRDLLGHLDGYLQSLESALGNLCQGATPSQVHSQINLADRRYNLLVGRQLRRTSAWVSRREFIFPAGKPAVVDCGMAALTALTLKKRMNLIGFLRARVLESSCSEAEKWGLLEELNKARREQKAVRAAQILRGLLTHGVILRSWSKPLGKICPSKNAFFEISFKYD